MKILITGANGQLGTELQRILRDGKAGIGSISASYKTAEVVGTDTGTLDITNEAAVKDYIHSGKFDLVINCAAMTNVDGCEEQEAAAYRVNAAGPANLANAAQSVGAKFVQVSTDYVFSGSQSADRVESDAVDPQSAYGRTKLAGERLAMEKCERCFVVRTAWLYGYVGKNFVKTMMHLGTLHREVFVVDDQLGNPTSANDVAYEILKIALTENYGVYHCTNNGTCSWADFAAAIMEGAHLDCAVQRCTSAQYKQKNPAAAERPAFSSLRNKYLEDTVGDEMRPWQVALSDYFENYDRLNG
jgi:dTDP-4-dehydrorhamnose reductase